MNFHPVNVELYGNRIKILNYYNLNHSPAYLFPKNTRSSWLPKSQYTPPSNPIKTKSNCKYTELYNTREQYIHESKKITAPKYSFGKEGMEENDFYKKTKQNKKRAKSAKYKNKNFEEENIEGDNCINQDNKNNKEEKKEETYHQYYEIGKQFVNQSTQNKSPLYSFAGGAFGKKYLTESRVDHNFKPEHDFYELRKAYVKESKKPKILGYSFGKQKRLDANIKKKWKYKMYNNNSSDNNDNKKDKNKFKEEKNFNQGDKYENVIIPDEKKEQKNLDNKKNKQKEETKLNLSKDAPHDYYNLREHYIYESQKPRLLGYSFGKNPRIKKGKLSNETFFYNLNDHYIYESQKPKAPNYSFGRPQSAFIINNKNKNNKNKTRPKSAYINKNEERKIMPGPGNYDIPNDFGINGLKISMPHSGRKYGKNNGVPGPGRYTPDINVVKYKYPIYSIGISERDGCSYPLYYSYKKNRRRIPYGVQYYRKNPSWIFAKTCKGEELHKKILKENNRYV